MRSCRKDNLNKYLKVYDKPIIPKIFRFLYFGERRLITGKEGDSDKIYYIIRINPEQRVGVFAYYRHVLGHIIYAIDCGYIPVVNFRDYKNMYIDWPNANGTNGWEIFFEQPFGIDVEYALNCKNVILSDVRSKEDVMDYNNYTASRLEIKKIANSYIRFNDTVNEKTNAAYTELLAGKGKICGIKLRGSDYAISKFKNHAVVPEVSKAFEDVMNAIASWDEQYDYYFLSTEDESIYEYYQSKLGEKLICMDINRYKPTQIWYESEKTTSERHQEGYDYCVDVGLLSRCDALVTTICQGAGAAVMLNNGKYENVTVLTYGVY